MCARHHQSGEVEPSSHPLLDRCTRSDGGWHVVGGLPHGNAAHSATEVTATSQRLRFHLHVWLFLWTFCLKVCVALRWRKRKYTSLMPALKIRLSSCVWLHWMKKKTLQCSSLISPWNFTTAMLGQVSSSETAWWRFIYYLSPSERAHMPGTCSSTE